MVVATGVVPGGLVALLAFAAAGPAFADILLGGVGPLSQPGDVAGGQEMKWAMEQAVADLNAKGGVMGRKLRLNFYDTQNKPDVCAAIAKKMVQDDKVVAVVGEFHSGCALAQIPTYNQAGTPVVFSETYNDKITGGDPADPNLPQNPPTIFRIAPASTYYSGFVVDWIVNGVKAKKVAYVTDTTDYGTGAADAVKKALDGTGIELKQVTVELAQPDYASILSRLKTEFPNADVAYLDISETATGYIVTQNAIDVGLVNDKTICVGNPGFRDDKCYWRAVPNGVGCLFQLVGLTSANITRWPNRSTSGRRRRLGMAHATMPSRPMTPCCWSQTRSSGRNRPMRRQSSQPSKPLPWWARRASIPSRTTRKTRCRPGSRPGSGTNMSIRRCSCSSSPRRARRRRRRPPCGQQAARPNLARHMSRSNKLKDRRIGDLPLLPQSVEKAYGPRGDMAVFGRSCLVGARGHLSAASLSHRARIRSSPDWQAGFGAQHLARLPWRLSSAVPVLRRGLHVVVPAVLLFK